jgi:hypothetical protein
MGGEVGGLQDLGTAVLGNDHGTHAGQLSRRRMTGLTLDARRSRPIRGGTERRGNGAAIIPDLLLREPT